MRNRYLDITTTPAVHAARFDAEGVDRYDGGDGPFVNDRLGPTEAAFIAAWEDIFTPNEPMAQLVETLHTRRSLHLLSNTNDIHRAFFFGRYPVFRHFTGGTYSDVVRASKPNRAIYEIACRDLAIKPASTFFIDDLLPNIETARALGFQTHHYHHERHGDLLAALTAAGVKWEAA